jgi:membrane protein DedA with SNARE-associated domain
MIPGIDSLPAGGWALFVALAFATYASEDLACIAAGLLVADGRIGFFEASAACFIGIWTGDMLLVVAGRGIRTLTRGRLLKWLDRGGRLTRAEDWIRRRGPAVAWLSRFTPGMRLVTYLAAGILRAPLLVFGGWLALAGLVWTPVLVGIATLFGNAIAPLLVEYERWAIVVLAGVVLAIWFVSRLGIALMTWRGRQLLLGRWRRLTHWEFWPMWTVYAPVCADILLRLAPRHGGLGTFSAVNPGIEAGGFIGESKSAILGLFPKDDARIAKSRLLADEGVEMRNAVLHNFMAADSLEFPIVLKPDSGERGEGVAIIRSAEAACEYLEAHAEPVLAQEYVPGVEFGIFYTRRPADDSGSIFAVTEKQFPHVTGDGVSTLEELILADARAVCMAPLHLENHRERLDSVPAAGEHVTLVQIGNHCRGTLFLDGRWVLTPELVASIDGLSKLAQGFFFGRYDVRAESVEALQAGRGFKVIELNGATSEATSIYDPRYSIVHAWRTLRAQWSIAFEIGETNRAFGAKTMRASELWRMLRAERRRRRRLNTRG